MNYGSDRRSNRWNSVVVAIVLVASLSQGTNVFSQTSAESAPTVSGADTFWCAPASVAEGYITDAQLDHLRRLFADNRSTGPFSGLGSSDIQVVTQALRIGQGAAFFAARLLRDIAIIEALDQQAECSTGSCEKPTIISGFKTGGAADPNKDQSWTDLAREWRGGRDRDARSGTPCLTMAASLPTRPSPQLTPPSPKIVVAEKPPESPTEPLPIGVPKKPTEAGADNVREAAKEAEPKDVGNDADCHNKFVAIAAKRTIGFSKSSAAVNSQDIAFLTGLVKSVKACPSLRIAVDGYTDSDGSNRYNKELSVKRAKAVAFALSSAGIDGAQISAKGFGEARPVVPNTSNVNKARNRRVEIVLR